MEFVIRNFWIAFILVMLLNGLIFKIRSIKNIKENPELEEGYIKILKNLLIYGNIPWVIMGIGNITKLTNSIFEYFNPSSLNPIVLLFHASIIYIWIVSILWIYKRNGAQFLEDHPGLFNSSVFGTTSKSLTANQIKIFYPLCLAGGIAGMVMMWVNKVPLIF